MLATLDLTRLYKAYFKLRKMSNYAVVVHENTFTLNDTTIGPIKPGINMHLRWSDHDWTVLSTGVNALKTH